MTASPYASAAKIDEALAAIGAEHVGTREQTILQQIFVACATAGSSPSAPPVPQNLRLASVQNPNSITVTWDALVESPDYEVEVYTPDDVWVSLGGTMGGITREYGVSDGMVYGATYSFRVRSTFDFVTFSDWSAPLYGVVAPSTPTFYYRDQGSGVWGDPTNWFQDPAGTIPYGSTPTSSDNCLIIGGNTVDQVPNSGYNSVTNNGTVTNNFGVITTNDATGTITTNNNVVGNNYGTVTNNGGAITTNNNVVGYNYGTVTINYNVVTYNYGIVDYNGGTVTYNCGTIVNDQGSSGSCPT